MEVVDRIARYDKWCSSCKHADDDEWDVNSPCYDCMFTPVNQNTDKPINYIPNKKEEQK